MKKNPTVLLFVCLLFFLVGCNFLYAETNNLIETHRTAIAELKELERQSGVEQERLMQKYWQLDAARKKVSTPEKIKALNDAMKKVKAKYDDLRKASIAREKDITKHEEAIKTEQENTQTEKQMVSIYAGESSVSELAGTVEVLDRTLGKWVKIDEGYEFKVGDKIKTGKDGRVKILLKNESGECAFVLNNSTCIEVESRNREPWINFSMGQLNIYYNRLTKGRGECINIAAPTAVASVRGTKFDFFIDENKLAHLVPEEGTMELTALPDAIDRSKLDAWYQKQLPSGPQKIPGKDAWALISYAEGAVYVKDASGVQSTALRNYELNKHEILITGNQGFAQVVLLNGYVVSLRSNSELCFEKNDSETDVLCSIKKGILHFVDLLTERTKRNVLITTPTAVVAVRGTEGDITVGEDGKSDFVLLDGKVEITSKPSKKMK